MNGTIVHCRRFEELFPIVKASELSLNDKFMQYEPNTLLVNQKQLKYQIESTIKKGVSDFRKPVMDPSEDSKKNIIFEKGKLPAVGHSARWWAKKSHDFMPSKNSRLGSPEEYYAFLGILIKYLVEEQGYMVSKAWAAVCDDSCELGHYKNSDSNLQISGRTEINHYGLTNMYLEYTGSRRVAQFYDLANTFKLLRSDELPGVRAVKRSKPSCFMSASGSYDTHSERYPLADIGIIISDNIEYSATVGWIVLDV